MNENINIAKILKNVPKGTKLWSPLCGECYLLGVELKSPITVEVKGDENNSNCKLFFAADGKYFSRFTSSECLLFPSKENRDWSTFKAPWKHKHFELGQKVLVPYYSGTMHRWRLTFYSHYDEGTKQHITTDNMFLLDGNIIPYESNEDKLGKPVE